jgi:saccharopine dehydrogenase-like NADP-dependent oxidoreductase
MPNGTDILITGGYGTVGCRVAADLASDYPDRVVVAGRNTEKATRLAAELGHGVRGRRGDVGDPGSVEATLDGVGVVMSCIDQPEPHLLRAVIGRGLAYTDIAPHLMTRRPTEAMKAEAARSGAWIVLGAGLAPGILSLLARLGADRVGAVEKVEVGVLLSVGDAYGPASRAYLLEERVQRLNTWLRRRYEGRDFYGVAVEVAGARGRVRASLVGRGQATATAIGAAAVVRALAEGEVKRAGIWLAEEVVAPESFFGHLAARGLVPTFEDTLEGSHSFQHGKGGSSSVSP